MPTQARRAAGALALLLLAASAPASAARATLAYAAGAVTIEASGTSRAGRAGTDVPSGASVSTAKGATAVVALPDGSRLKLRELSRVTVTLPSKASSLTDVLLGRGGIFAEVAKRLRGHEFHVRTQTAVAAVLGTEFFTAFGRGSDLWICVNHGVVRVTADGSAKPAELRPGQGVLIKGGKDLTKPQAYDWTKTLNWNVDPARGGVEDKTSLDSAYTDLLDQDYR